MKQWDDFDKFENVNEKYLPSWGQGETMATQVCTAVNKLVYKWFNDGDVFDNRYGLEGWCNDLSSYANWLHAHTGAGNILEGIRDCWREDQYTDLLYDLCVYCMRRKYLEQFEKEPAVGTIYDCKGPFEFEEYDAEEEDW